MTVSFSSNKWQIKRRKKKTQRGVAERLEGTETQTNHWSRKENPPFQHFFFLMFKRNFSWSKEMSEEISTLF